MKIPMYKNLLNFKVCLIYLIKIKFIFFLIFFIFSILKTLEDTTDKINLIHLSNNFFEYLGKVLFGLIFCNFTSSLIIFLK